MKNNEALLIIDMERGFMPASEGERLGLQGFGELPVPGGELIIPHINELTLAFGGLRRNFVKCTRDINLLDHGIGCTRDAHPDVTAHFSDEPNFVDTWPRHCVWGTQGAELHPDLIIAHTMDPGYLKGEDACETPADDDSYTGVLSHSPITGHTLPEDLRAAGTRSVYLTGVALGDGDRHKLCVDSTAVDLHEMGFDVTVVTDATEAVLPENKALCFKNLGAMGIKLATTGEVLDHVRA